MGPSFKSELVLKLFNFDFWRERMSRDPQEAVHLEHVSGANQPEERLQAAGAAARKQQKQRPVAWTCNGDEEKPAMAGDEDERLIAELDAAHAQMGASAV